MLADNGMIGGVPLSKGETADPSIKDAGDHYSRLLPGGCFFNSATAFGLVRGGVSVEEVRRKTGAEVYSVNNGVE